MVLSDAQLENFCITNGLLARRDFASIRTRMAQTQESLQTALIHSGMLSADDVRRAEALSMGIPFIRLSSDNIDPDALTLIPEPFSRSHNLIAFRRSEHAIEVACLSTQSLPEMPFLRKDMRVLIRLTDEKSVRQALLQYQKQLKKTIGISIIEEVRVIEDITGDTLTKNPSQLRAVSKLVDALFEQALLNHATDLHIATEARGLLVRQRIGGALYETTVLPARVASAVHMRLRQLAALSLTAEVPQQGRFRLEADNTSVIASIFSIATDGRERTVVHLVPQHSGQNGFALEALGFQHYTSEHVFHALKKPGLLLVCGSKGAGKTTTQHTLLDLLISPEKNIVVIEQETTQSLTGVTHVRPNSAIGLSYTEALRTALRHDPDVLILEAITDSDIAMLATSAANRGIMVIAGIEALSAAEGVERLMHLAPPTHIAATLRSAICVSLTRRLCDRRSPSLSSREDFNQLERIVDPVRIFKELRVGSATEHTHWKELKFSQPVACERCDEGYNGQVGLQEILPVTAVIKEQILVAADAPTLAETAKNEGMLTLLEDGIYKAALGYTTLAEIFRVAEDRQGLYSNNL